MKFLGPRALGLADQVLASACTFILTVLAARVLPASSFGQFAILQVVVLVVVGLAQSSVGEHLITYSHNLSATQTVRIALGASTLVCGPAIIGLGLLGWFLSPNLMTEILLTAVAAILAVYAETCRYGFISSGLPGAAIAVDSLRVTAVAVGALVFGGSNESIIGVLTVWISSSSVVVVISGICWRAYPSLLTSAIWLSRNRRQVSRFGLEYVAVSMSTQAATLVAYPILGGVGMAAIRGSQLLYSPYNVLLNGARIAYIPHLRGKYEDRPIPRLKLEFQLALSAAVFAIVIVLIGDSIGESILGDSWQFAEPLIPLTALQYVLLAWYWGLVIRFRVSLLEGSSSLMRAVFSIATLVFPVVGALTLGAIGVVIGFSVAAASAIVAGEICLSLANRSAKLRTIRDTRSETAQT